jgi:hypothetical protein
MYLIMITCGAEILPAGGGGEAVVKVCRCADECKGEDEGELLAWFVVGYGSFLSYGISFERLVLEYE